MTHEQFQAECMLWYRNTRRATYRMCFAIDNNPSPRLPAELRQIEGVRKLHVGIRDGVWDCIYIGYGYIAIIDFKVGNDRLSEAQCVFRDQLLERGHDYSFEIRPPIDNFKNLILWLENRDKQQQISSGNK